MVEAFQRELQGGFYALTGVLSIISEAGLKKCRDFQYPAHGPCDP
jgi:hypothetical protein